MLPNKELGYGALWALGGIALTAITDGAVIFTEPFCGEDGFY